MDWVKLGVRYYLDPKIRGIDGDLADAAEVMFTRGIARAGEVGMAGFIPEQDVPLLTRRRRYAAVVRVLTDSGLWTAVPGGYQVKRWSGWQEHLDALTRKRAADRDRQRARRAAARNGSTSEDRPPPNLSRDTSRDVQAVEGEGEKELGGTGKWVTTGAVHSRASPPVENTPQNGHSPPSRYCRRHPAGTDANCGPCKDARLAAEAYDRQQAQHRAERDRANQRHPRCGTCGTRHPTGECPADPKETR